MDEKKKSRIISTNTVQPREFEFQPRHYGGFTKQETRKPGGIITTANLEQRQRNELRKALAEKRKRLMAERKAMVKEAVEEAARDIVDEVRFKKGGKKTKKDGE